jgi:hypothetical protein
MAATIRIGFLLAIALLMPKPIPIAGDRHTPARWFWEPTHLKKQPGAIMIQRVVGEGAPEFGVRLTPANVANRNAQVRSQRQARVCGLGRRLC